MPQRLVALLLFAALLEGCAPSCTQLCRKLDRCAFDAERTVAECTRACEAELTAVRDSDAQDEVQDAFFDHRVCLGASTCDEIAAGACFDPLLFPFPAGG